MLIYGDQVWVYDLTNNTLELRFDRDLRDLDAYTEGAVPVTE